LIQFSAQKWDGLHKPSFVALGGLGQIFRLEKLASTLNAFSVFLLLAIGSKEDRFLDIERSGANRFGEIYSKKKKKKKMTMMSLNKLYFFFLHSFGTGTIVSQIK
jgi:hypothetical protein